MQIIDSKGKLFGKINLVDFMIILAVIMTGIISVKYFLSREKSDFETYIIKITPHIKGPWFFQAISIGDTEKDKDGNVIARIIGKDSENAVVIAEIAAEVLKGDLLFKDNKIKVGSQIIMETRDVIVRGIISDIQWTKKGEAIAAQSLEIETKSVVVKVRLDNKDPWFLEAIHIGDTEVRERDGKNVIIAKILTKELSPSKVMIPQKGTIVSREHPFKKDIILTVKLICEVFKGELMFKGKKIRIGRFINLETKNSSITGVISDVQTVSPSLQK